MTERDGRRFQRVHISFRGLAVLLLLAAAHSVSIAQMDFTGARRDLAAGATLRTIAAGDLNGDGKKDLVVVAGSSNAVSILLNAGNGVFRAATQVATSDFPNDATLGSFNSNSDSILDMAVASYLGDRIEIFLGNGAGGFGAPTSIMTGLGSNPSAIEILDWNRDGKKDLVVALHGANSYRLYTGNGAGGFSLQGEYPVELGPVAVAAADLDADGYVDVAVVSEGDTSLDPPPNGTVRVAWGCPTGFCFPATTTVLPAPASVAFGLLNNDVYMDLVVGSAGGDNLAILYLDPDFGYTGVTPLAVGGASACAAVGDYNGDTKQDLAVCVERSGGQGSVKIFTGNGLGTFTAGNSMALGSAPADVVSVDFAGSTALDLATANTTAASTSLLIGNGAGSFTKTPEYAFPAYSNLAGLVSADLNGNGTVDLAVARYDGTLVDLDSLALLQGSGTGTFSAWQTLTLRGTSPGDARAGPILLAPFVGGGSDNNPDLAVLLGGVDNSALPAVEVFPGNGAGVFGVKQDYTLGYSCINVGAGEYDCLDPQAMTSGALNDADTLHPDIAVSVLGGDDAFPLGSLSVFLQSGSVLGAATRYTGGGSPACVGGLNPGAPCTVRDDCSGRCSVSSTVHCYADANCPAGETCYGQAGNCTIAPTGLAAGLVNSDANRDLMVCGGANNKASYLPGNGTGAFSSVGSLTGTGVSPQWPMLKDLDGDGDLDMTILNSFDFTAYSFLGDNAGNFTLRSQVPGVADPFRGVMADLNLDGWDDLAVGNLSSGTVSVLLGDGTGRFGDPVLIGVGSVPRYLSTADYNGDGKADLAVSNEGDGTISILLNASQAPVLTATSAGSTVNLAWQAMFEARSYDVIRGLVSQLTQTATQINLGAVTCVENDSPDSASSETANPPQGSIYFYLMRTQDSYVKGSYGRSTLNKIRIPTSGDCL